MMTMNEAWISTLFFILRDGAQVSPRGQLTYEILQHNMEVDMRRPVLTIPQRKLSYKFMAAEAYWIMTGDYRVATIKPYNKYITQFSDDGVVFYGAYGPKVMGQMSYVVNKLLEDKDTRQAGLTIWRENPQKSKDIPCTVAMFFNIRDSKLNCHVFMRSSDIWLGVPYDVFNFSMISHLVCARYNETQGDTELSPGALYLTAASRHLYDWDKTATIELTSADVLEPYGCNPTPDLMYCDSEFLMGVLKEVRASKPGDAIRWWEV